MSDGNELEKLDKAAMAGLALGIMGEVVTARRALPDEPDFALVNLAEIEAKAREILALTQLQAGLDPAAAEGDQPVITISDVSKPLCPWCKVGTIDRKCPDCGFELTDSGN